MNGMEVLEELRQRDAACILLTGDSDVSHRGTRHAVEPRTSFTNRSDMNTWQRPPPGGDKARTRRINEALLVQARKDTDSTRSAPPRECKTSPSSRPPGSERTHYVLPYGEAARARVGGPHDHD